MSEILALIQFCSNVAGIIICICLCCPLLYHTQTAYYESKSETIDIKSDGTTTNMTISMNEKINLRKHAKCNKLCTHLELWSSLECVISTLFYLCEMTFFSSFFSSFTNITMTNSICNILGKISSITFFFSRYGFFTFMLYRIKLTFKEPMGLRMKSIVYKINLIFIHILVLYGMAIGTTIKSEYNINTNKCVYRVDDAGSFTQYIPKNNRDTAYMRFAIIISFMLDTIFTLTLLYMYLKRMYRLTKQNKKINSFIRRVMISGITATLSSVAIALIVTFVGNDAQYFTNIDLIINAICIVVTFKFHCLTCNRKTDASIKSDNDENDSDQIAELMDLFDEEGNLSMMNVRKQQNKIDVNEMCIISENAGIVAVQYN